MDKAGRKCAGGEGGVWSHALPPGRRLPAMGRLGPLCMLPAWRGCAAERRSRCRRWCTAPHRQLMSLSFAGMGVSMLLMAAGLSLPFLSGEPQGGTAHAWAAETAALNRAPRGRPPQLPAADHSSALPPPLCLRFVPAPQARRVPLRWWARWPTSCRSPWAPALCPACWCLRSRRRACGVRCAVLCCAVLWGAAGRPCCAGLRSAAHARLPRDCSIPRCPALPPPPPSGRAVSLAMATHWVCNFAIGQLFLSAVSTFGVPAGGWAPAPCMAAVHGSLSWRASCAFRALRVPPPAPYCHCPPPPPPPPPHTHTHTHTHATHCSLPLLLRRLLCLRGIRGACGGGDQGPLAGGD